MRFRKDIDNQELPNIVDLGRRNKRIIIKTESLFADSRIIFYSSYKFNISKYFQISSCRRNRRKFFRAIYGESKKIFQINSLQRKGIGIQEQL